MKISREWATPLTIGVFALMASTGLLMFFHLDTPLQETMHEWAGWVMVAAVAAHVAVNWVSFKRYVTARGRGMAIVSTGVLVVALSFAIQPAGGRPSVPGLAINALQKAPLHALAALYGKSSVQARADLATAGINLPSDEATLASATGGSREKLGLALAALARPAAP